MCIYKFDCRSFITYIKIDTEGGMETYYNATVQGCMNTLWPLDIFEVNVFCVSLRWMNCQILINIWKHPEIQWVKGITDIAGRKKGFIVILWHLLKGKKKYNCIIYLIFKLTILNPDI